MIEGTVYDLPFPAMPLPILELLLGIAIAIILGAVMRKIDKGLRERENKRWLI